MGGIFDTIWNNYLRNLRITDILDMAIIAFLIYKGIKFITKSATMRVMRGIIILFVVMGLATVLDLYVIKFLLGKTMEFGVLVLVVLFQPELRKLLERVGSSAFMNIFGKAEVSREMELAINETISACEDMSRSRTGALIIFEREIKLDDTLKTGTTVNADLNAELLKNIFFPNTPLHDGAVIIRDGRIAAAGCILPNSSNPNISKELGTRHRAGIGMSEVSDAVVIVVSEETGSISVAVDGMFKRHLAHDTFEKILRNELMPEDEDTVGSRSSRLKIAQKIKGKKNGKENNK
ncbi:MAG: diadenylate cyclase CdaA [Oscillospiraceae bacterium]|nr:diadenylate cyclase CdaA [Oscillospiraceae bacterium]